MLVQLKLNINLNKSGNWYVWGRMFFESAGKPRNSFYLQIDNGPKFIFGDDDNSGYDKWHWEGNKNTKLNLGNISAGNYTITIYGREIGSGTVLLDELLLTSDASLIASDNMGQSTGNSSSGDLVLKTENTILNGDVHLKSKTCSLGSKVLYFLNSSSTAKIKFNVPSTGQWYAWGRMFFESAVALEIPYTFKLIMVQRWFLVMIIIACLIVGIGKEKQTLNLV